MYDFHNIDKNKIIINILMNNIIISLIQYNHLIFYLAF